MKNLSRFYNVNQTKTKTQKKASERVAQQLGPFLACEIKNSAIKARKFREQGERSEWEAALMLTVSSLDYCRLAPLVLDYTRLVRS